MREKFQFVKPIQGRTSIRDNLVCAIRKANGVTLFGHAVCQFFCLSNTPLKPGVSFIKTPFTVQNALFGTL